MTPIPRVSTQKYAKVRFRIKGEKDGPVYQGQVIVVPCVGCGQKKVIDYKPTTLQSQPA